MRAEEAVNSRQNQQAEMGKRTKRSVPQQDIAGRQFGMDLRDARKVMLS